MISSRQIKPPDSTSDTFQRSCVSPSRNRKPSPENVSLSFKKRDHVLEQIQLIPLNNVVV